MDSVDVYVGIYCVDTTYGTLQKNDVHLLKPLLLLCHIAVTNKTLEDKNDNILENIIYMYRCNALHKKPSASSEEAFHLSHSCAANIKRLESQHHLY